MSSSRSRTPETGFAAWASVVRSRGTETYGQLALDAELLRGQLVAIMERSAREPDTLHAADLYIACAIEQGVDGAWEALIATHRNALQSMLISRGAPSATAVEIVDSLPGTLLLKRAPSGGRTRLASYDGSGSLRAWLGIIAVRGLLQDRRRRAAGNRAVRARRDESEASADPATAAAIGESGVRLAQQLRDAWAALAPRSRLAVSLRYIHGLRGAQIATLLRIGQPRVSRIIDAAIGQLRTVLASSAASGPAAESLESFESIRHTLAAELANLAATEQHLPHGDDPLGAS